MKNRKIVIATAIIGFIFMGLNSCSKDNLELLSDTLWDFEDFSTNSENTNIQSLIALGKAALTDGTLEFEGGGNYTLDSPIMEAEAGTWELVGSNQIVFPEGGLSRPATIEELTKKKLVYFETYVYEGESYSEEYVWNR